MGGKGVEHVCCEVLDFFFHTSSMLENLEEGEKARHEEAIMFLYSLKDTFLCHPMPMEILQCRVDLNNG